MIFMIYGGSGSGKSEFAEKCCMEMDSGRKLYIATMEPFGEEGKARVEKHRKQRAGKGFDTLECYTHLEEADGFEGKTVLLECISNLVANEMFSPEGRPDRVVDVVKTAVDKIAAQTKNLIIVTNDVYGDGNTYDDSTKQYLINMAVINKYIASKSDMIYEITMGMPILIK